MDVVSRTVWGLFCDWKSFMLLCFLGILCFYYWYFVRSWNEISLHWKLILMFVIPMLMAVCQSQLITYIETLLYFSRGMCYPFCVCRLCHPVELFCHCIIYDFLPVEVYKIIISVLQHLFRHVKCRACLYL